MDTENGNQPIKIIDIIDEDFTNYKKTSMFLIFPFCTFKCERETGLDCCQNRVLGQSKKMNLSAKSIVDRFLNNPITSAIVCGGLEPFDSFNSLLALIKELRQTSDADVVIYTGYNKGELRKQVKQLKPYKNIIIKYGRFVPNDQSYYNDVLGVELASRNQWAEKL